MTRVPSPGGSSGDFISVNPQDLGDTAPIFTNVSHLTFEQDLIVDSMIESVLGNMELLHSLADFAKALQEFKERVSEIMHCIGNEEIMVGEALVGVALAFGANESIIRNMFNPLNPQPGTVIPLIPPIVTDPVPGVPVLEPGPDRIPDEVPDPELIPEPAGFPLGLSPVFGIP